MACNTHELQSHEMPSWARTFVGVLSFADFCTIAAQLYSPGSPVRPCLCKDSRAQYPSKGVTGSGLLCMNS
jgi:hypothetical protein